MGIFWKGKWSQLSADKKLDIHFGTSSFIHSITFLFVTVLSLHMNRNIPALIAVDRSVSIHAILLLIRMLSAKLN